MGKYLVRKNVILDSGLKAVDETTFVPFDNIRIIGNIDGNETILPTYDQVTNIALSIKNSPWNTKYQLVDDLGATLPSANVLNNLYKGTGIFAERLVDGVAVLLKETPVAGGAFEEISATNGDAIQIVISQTGTVESAVFANGAWFIDTSSNVVVDKTQQIETQINDINVKNTNQDIALNQLRGEALIKDSRITGPSVLYTQAEVDGMISVKDTQINILNNIVVGQQGALNANEVDINVLENKVGTYENERSSYVKFTDLITTVVDTFTSTGVTNASNEVIYSFGKTTLLQVTPNISWRFVYGTKEFFATVPINSANHSVSLDIDGNEIAAIFNVTPTQIKISGLTNAQANLIDNYQLVSGIQEGKVSGQTLDQTARDAASAAQAKADTADGKANTNTTAIANLVTKTDTTNTDLATYKASNNTAVGNKADKADVDHLKGLPVRTINAQGTEVSVDMSIYTPDALTNGFVDKTVLTKSLSAIVTPTKKMTLVFDDGSTEDVLVG